MNKIFDWGDPGALGTMGTIYGCDTWDEAEAKFREMRMQRQDLFNEQDIRKSPDNQNWFYLCYWFIMTEEFMREFQDYIVWGLVEKYQDISDNFRREFKDKLK